MTGSPKVSSEDSGPDSRVPRLWPLALLAVSYLAAVRVGVAFAVQPEAIGVIRPASGVALAALILCEQRKWPVLLGVIYVCNALGNLTGGNPFSVSLGFALANTAEPALGAWTLVRVCGTGITFGRLREVVALVGAATLCNAVTALLGSAVPALAFGAPYFQTWFVWWIAAGLGIVLVTPLIVTWATGPNVIQSVTRAGLVERAVFFIVLTFVSWFVFSFLISPDQTLVRPYLVLSLLIWAALRLRPRGIATGLAIFAFIGVVNTVRGLGTFGFEHLSIQERLISLQSFLVVASISGLILAAVVAEYQRTQDALRQSESRFRRMVETSGTVILSLAPDHTILEFNPSAETLYGKTRAEVIGRNYLDLFIPERDQNAIAQDARMVLSGTPTRGFVNPVIAADRKERVLVWNVDALTGPDGQPTGIVAVGQDITERVAAEESLRKSEEKYRKLFDQARDAILIADATTGEILDCNPAATMMFGFEKHELIGRHQAALHPPTPTRSRFSETFVRHLGPDEGKVLETQIVTRPGEIREVAIIAATLHLDDRKVIQGMFRDITDEKRTQDQIKDSLQEKRVLLNEVHHRVKNNLAVIYSLLRLQAGYVKDETCRALLDESRSRVKSMALAHELLYRSRNFASLDIRDYIGKLLDHLTSSSAQVGTRVEIEKHIEQIALRLDTAIPMGFILTELVTNCVKHAFRDRPEGRISVVLRSADEKNLELIVADNGIGFPEYIDLHHPASLGLDLVDSFVHKLKGVMEVSSTQGTRISIRFPRA